MSAYVEIIFDNTDERFPTGKDELILRRTIGLKKDEYSLDRKNATKADVMNLLESAGFSRSNPYYIVPQGRVTTLTNMKDSERLNLLKEVAGTQVYESRRSESVKIMHETNNKRSKIDELLDYINDRLGELEEEMQELRSYQDKDREKRCLEYTIYSREQQEISNALDQIEDQRQTGVDDTDENRQTFASNEEEMAQVSAEMAEVKQQVDFLNVDKRQLEDERKEAAKIKAQAELQLKTIVDGQTQAQKIKDRHDKESRRVQAAIKERESELTQLLPKYNNQKQEEQAAKERLDAAETTRQRLYAKQGRNSKFRNKKERDDWLRAQINDTFTSLSQVKAVRMQITEETTQLEQDVALMEPDIESLRKQLEGRGDAMQTLEQELLSAKEERDKLTDSRKELWREEAKLDSTIASAQQDVDRAERSLSHMMDSNTSRGLAAVRRIKKQHHLDGVYGTLAELIEVPAAFRTAVEVTAGNSLFHYVVDTDETATKVLETLNRERSGRITFMPLNRLKPKIPPMPSGNDVIPMVSKLQFDPMYQKAVEQVFGKTIVCPNLTTAAQYARSHGLSAITPEGDRSDKKGALTGGFHDPRHSRLEGVRNVIRYREEFDSRKARGAEVRKQIEKLDQTITKAMGELQRLEQRRNLTQSNHGPLRQELKAKLDLIRNKRDNLEAKQRQKSNVESNVKALTDQQSAHETELTTDFRKALTDAEEAQLEQLSSSVQDLRRQYSAISSNQSELESQKTRLQIELDDNLRPLLEQIQSAELEQTGSTSSASIKDRQRELKRLTASLQDLENRLHETEESFDTANSRILKLEARNAEIRRNQEELAKQIERHQRRMEKSMQKKAALQKQAKETSDSIRDLGVLPEEAFTKFKNTDSNAVVKRLHKVNEALKKYSHVNKKAFEQYNNFTKQREQLRNRRAELDASQKSIDELIEVLDQRKDEAIERTFKQVSKEFAAVFEKLVPAGRGRLIIQRKTDRRQTQGDEEDSEEEQARRESVENYTGVGISVSFNSKHDDQQRIQQLSGGQKSKIPIIRFCNGSIRN